jgi:hypothetical protein
MSKAGTISSLFLKVGEKNTPADPKIDKGEVLSVILRHHHAVVSFYVHFFCHEVFVFIGIDRQSVEGAGRELIGFGIVNKFGKRFVPGSSGHQKIIGFSIPGV